MSDRRFVLTAHSVAVTLAVHLGREDAGLYLPAETITRDVEALISAGQAVRKAVASGKSADSGYAKAAKVAQAYGARVVRAGEIEGVSLGLCFWSARHGVPGSVFRVS